MPIVAVCPSCKKQYQVNEKSVGKSVRCKACQRVFTVTAQAATANKTAAASPAAEPAPSKKDTAKKDSAVDQRARQFGLSPLPKNPNWSLPSFIRQKSDRDPLANHVITEPGFAFVSSGDYVPPGLAEEKSIAEQYMEAAEEDEDESNIDHGARNALFTVYGTVLGGPVVSSIMLLGFSLGSMEASGTNGWVVIMMALLVLFVSWITKIVFLLMQLLTHATTMEVLLSFVVPFFYFYVVIKYFDDLKHSFILVMLWPLVANFSIFFAFGVGLLLGGSNFAEAFQ